MKKLLETFRTGTLASIISISSAQAEPFAEFTNASGGTERIDCGELTLAKDKKGKERTFMTCDFAEQIKPKGEICSHTNNIPTKLDKITTTQLYSSTQAAISATIHFGRNHNDCIGRAAVIDGKSKVRDYMKRGMSKNDARTKALNEVSKLYGSDWQSQKSCTIKNAKNACDTALGLD